MQKGTKETMEVMALVGVIAQTIFKEVRGDGLDWTDAMKLVTDSTFQSKLAEAVSGISEVKAELNDLNASEGLEIAEFAIKVAKDILKAA